MMKKYLALLIFLFSSIAHWAWAQAPIDFGEDGATHVKRLKMSHISPIDLYRSANPQHNNAFFTARTMFRLGPQGLADYEQKELRNEICASNKVFENAARADIGSIGLYQRDLSVVSIADNSLVGQPLTSVLRELATKPTEKKRGFVLYYAANMVDILDALQNAEVTWNNLSLRNFYVRPNGRLYAFDLSEAHSDPATLDEDQQQERNHFMTATLPHMLALLFPDPDDALVRYRAFVTQTLGTDAAAVAADADADEARTHDWTIDEIKQMLMARLRVLYGQAAQTAAQNLAEFDNNIDTFLDTPAVIPHTPPTAIAVDAVSVFAANLRPEQHQAAAAGNRGNNGFGIDEAVRLLTDRGDGQPYDDLAAMCEDWTGR